MGYRSVENSYCGEFTEVALAHITQRSTTSWRLAEARKYWLAQAEHLAFSLESFRYSTW